MRKIEILDVIALALVVIGAINWGLMGMFGLNLVSSIFGEGAFSRLIYSLVGISGVYSLHLFGEVHHFAHCSSREHAPTHI